MQLRTWSVAHHLSGAGLLLLSPLLEIPFPAPGKWCRDKYIPNRDRLCSTSISEMLSFLVHLARVPSTRAGKTFGAPFSFECPIT